MEREEASTLLKVDNKSDEFYKLISLSNQQSRKQFGNKGFVFAQIGMNAEPCSQDCKFCSLGMSHYSIDNKWQKGINELKPEVQQLLNEGMNDFFLMTTADYSIQKFMKISAEIRKLLPDHIRFVANIGDFDLKTAKELKAIGITGAYHIKRLREGSDTLIDPEIRERTIGNIVNAGLELTTALNPLGLNIVTMKFWTRSILPNNFQLMPWLSCEGFRFPELHCLTADKSMPWNSQKLLQ